MLAPLLRTVFPLRCPGCGVPAEPVCATCARSLRPAPSVAVPPGIDAWAAPFAYEGVARELVARAKYRGAHAVLAWLAEAMARLVAPPLPSVVTWVPTTPRRARARGFDHAAVLAREVAVRLHRPVRRLLVRTDEAPQTGLSAAARRVGPGVVARAAVPVSVLVVDDVATTGASLTASALALRRAGATHVVALTAARTPPPAGR